MEPVKVCASVNQLLIITDIITLPCCQIIRLFIFKEKDTCIILTIHLDSFIKK